MHTMEDSWQMYFKWGPESDYRGKSRQPLSPLFSHLAINWIMKISTPERKHGIKYIAQNKLEDLDFADNLAFLYHIHKQMQMKTSCVTAASESVSLNINEGKSKITK